MDHNMNTGIFDASAIPPGAILALTVPPEGDGPRGPPQQKRRTPSQPRARAPTGTNPESFVLEFVIEAGEDLIEKVCSSLQEAKRFFAGDHDRTGTVLSASGDIMNPTIVKADTTLSFEGTHAIMQLNGCFAIPKNGPVEPSGAISIMFQMLDADIYGGHVVGGLIAATPIKVTVGIFIPKVIPPEVTGEA